MALTINQSIHDTQAVFKITGELSLYDSPEFKTKIKKALEVSGLTAVLLDMNDCSYIDSAGLGALFYLKKIFDSAHILFILKSVSEPVMKLIKLAAMDRLFTIET